MKLEEAIEILKGVELVVPIQDNSRKHRRAINLGIEALKREQRRRTLVSYHKDDMFIQLPGETKE